MKKGIITFILLMTLISLITAQNISIELNWDEDDIYYGRGFDIGVEIYNLENRTYDLKVWIQPEENKNVLTEIYDKEKDDWKSGNYYVNEFFEGPGNFSDEVELRIKEKYKNYTGKGFIHAKLRDNVEVEEKIEILEPESPEEPEPPKQEHLQEPEPSPESPINRGESSEPSIIQLSKSVTKTNNSTKQQETINTLIIYESKNQLIIKYSVFSFALLCVILSILINWRNFKI